MLNQPPREFPVPKEIKWVNINGKREPIVDGQKVILAEDLRLWAADGNATSTSGPSPGSQPRTLENCREVRERTASGQEQVTHFCSFSGGTATATGGGPTTYGPAQPSGPQTGPVAPAAPAIYDPPAARTSTPPFPPAVTQPQPIVAGTPAPALPAPVVRPAATLPPAPVLIPQATAGPALPAAAPALPAAAPPPVTTEPAPVRTSTIGQPPAMPPYVPPSGDAPPRPGQPAPADPSAGLDRP
jgi:hypothetical protein